MAALQKSATLRVAWISSASDVQHHDKVQRIAPRRCELANSRFAVQVQAEKWGLAQAPGLLPTANARKLRLSPFLRSAVSYDDDETQSKIALNFFDKSLGKKRGEQMMGRAFGNI